MRLTKLYLLFLLCISALKASAFNVDTLYICKGYCINYTNVTTQGIAVAWQWTFQGASTPSSTLQNPPNICYPTAGIFKTTVTTTFQDNSDSTDDVMIVVFDHPVPSFAFPPDTGYCQGNTLPLLLTTTIFPGLQYQWSTGARTPNLSINSQGTYWVDLVIRAGNLTCDSVRKQIVVTEYPRPSVYLGQDKTMCQGQVIVLDAGQGAGYRYNWSPNNEITRTVNATLPGVYSVTVTNQYGCQANDQIELIDSCPHYVFVPNAVSPNADRLNDLFIKVWNFTPKDYTFSIYNRWGELLFETMDMNAGWDGNYNGAPVEQDVYVYKITYFDTDKKWYELRGTFFVVR